MIVDVEATGRRTIPRSDRPSIDPVLMIRMLIVGYVFAIRSERALRREVQVNLACRWLPALDSLPQEIEPLHRMMVPIRPLNEQLLILI